MAVEPEDGQARNHQDSPPSINVGHPNQDAVCRCRRWSKNATLAMERYKPTRSGEREEPGHPVAPNSSERTGDADITADKLLDRQRHDRGGVREEYRGNVWPGTRRGRRRAGLACAG